MRTTEENREYQKKWRANNRAKVAADKKRHYEENKESYLQRASDFNKSDKRKQWREENKEHTSSYNKEYWLKRKDKKPHLKSNYGIDVQQYNDMFAFQEGKCLGCDRHQSEFKKALAVDHCHTTGKVRGLLCDDCNRALGLVRDNITILNRLAKYLESE